MVRKWVPELFINEMANKKFRKWFSIPIGQIGGGGSIANIKWIFGVVHFVNFSQLKSNTF